MILLIGSDAYSPFRMDALKDAITKLDPRLGRMTIDAKWVYALQMADSAFSVEELERAGVLLNAEGQCDEADFFVTPRKGTISPWSTKATDIFRNCGLKTVLRVERGIRFRLSGLPDGLDNLESLDGLCSVDRLERLEGDAIAKFYGIFHDRMTEGVYENIADLFEVDDPRPGRTYDVLAKGV